MFENSGHWVSSVSSRPTTGEPVSSLADINQNLQKRLQGLKGRPLRHTTPKGRPTGRCTSTPVLVQKPSRPERCQTAACAVEARAETSTLPSLDGLGTWSESNPFVAPPCPHERLIQAQSVLLDSERRELRRSRSYKPRMTLTSEGSRSSWLNDLEEEETKEELLPEEPFVDDYLEQILPTNYDLCPHAPVHSKLLPLQGSRASSAHGSVASSRYHQGSELKAHLKGKRQRLLERFATTKRAFDDFLQTIRELKKLRCWRGNLWDVELPQSLFFDFLSQHFADMPPEEHETIFSFFDTDGSGSVSLTEFYAVVEAMAPVRCLADLRCRWIALGFSPCRAMETMAPRTSWASKRYTCQQFGQLMTKVGVWDWEEHVFLFTAIATTNLHSTISLAEMHAALASVSPVLLIEDWQHRLEQAFQTMDKAYDALEGDFKAPLDLNKFVVKAGEMWNMRSNEAKRFFHLCDFDGKEKMTRTKFCYIVELVRPSLRLEHIRKKLRCHYSKMLGRIRSVNRQVSLEHLTQRILNGFLQHKEQPTRRRSRVPDDYQRMFDELQLTDQDMTMLFNLLDPRHPEKPELSCFWHMLKNFSPSVVLEDLCLLSVRICAAISKEVKEAQKLPPWQARQLGLATRFTPQLQTWSEVVDGSKAFDVFAGLLPGQACRAAGARREATVIAPLAALSCCPSGSLLEEERFIRLSKTQLKQVLHELFFERTDVQVKASVVMELLEDCQVARHAPRGLSIAELLAALGSITAEGPPVDTTPEGREARAQLEARSQFEPFTAFAMDLRKAVRQKVKKTVIPKALVTGSILEPLSYVNSSSIVEVPERENLVEEAASLRQGGPQQMRETLAARNEKLERVKLVKDQSLREMLEKEVFMETQESPAQTSGNRLALVKRQAGEEEFEIGASEWSGECWATCMSFGRKNADNFMAHAPKDTYLLQRHDTKCPQSLCCCCSQPYSLGSMTFRPQRQRQAWRAQRAQGWAGMGWAERGCGPNRGSNAATHPVLPFDVLEARVPNWVDSTAREAFWVKRSLSGETRSFYHHMEENSKYIPDEELVEKLRGYFHDAGGVVESQTALLSKKQNINSSHKSLKRALSLKRSIKDAARTARDL
ncbi:unnamed protein product [Durusdinium trenchii]|uniref:EF-hand domain-containing protein n=1 Tax=Durusdinium trenchii TaxID=1381693 RepID=A0ABP0R4D9_9DINO